MDGVSLTGSLDRLEAALERIEAAAREAQGRKAAAARLAEDDLEQRHRQLRSAVEGTLARLDALIDAGDAP